MTEPTDACTSLIKLREPMLDTVSLPSTAATPNSYGVAFSNDIFWLSNGTSWTGYKSHQLWLANLFYYRSVL